MKARIQQRILNGILLCFMFVLSLSAQAAFITDKFIVEVYAERFAQGAVLKKLSSGSTIDVLMKDGQYSRIRTNDNITGWVESKYITNEKPAQLEYLELLTKSKTLEAKLKSAEEKLANPAQGGDNIDIAEIEELRKRAADAGWMRVELKKARDRAIEVERKLKSSGQAATSSVEELNKLREQNQVLQDRLAASVLVTKEQGVFTQDVSTPSTETSTEDKGWTVNIEWFLGSIVVALIIGLIAGMTWLDKRIRQRHGGFRIY